ncbi:MAG TPA: hypothetical protein VE268_05480, partial [Herpetosiphonaceae bacterium]|nr:hypothetical protein [Herpetosiphonaceae bacterium]
MLKRPITRCALLFFSVCLTTMASRGVPTGPLVAGAQRPAAAQVLPASARSSDFVQPSNSDLVFSPSNASAGAPLAAGQALGLLSPLPGLTPTPVVPGVNGLVSPLPVASVASLLLPTATPLLGSAGLIGLTPTTTPPPPILSPEQVSALAQEMKAAEPFTPPPVNETPDLQPLPQVFASGASSTGCTYLGLQPIGVTAPWGALNPEAAASFAAVRAEVRARTGIDALAVEADVLRRPDFHTDKPGVI